MSFEAAKSAAGLMEMLSLQPWRAQARNCELSSSNRAVHERKNETRRIAHHDEQNKVNDERLNIDTGRIRLGIRCRRRS